MSQEDINGVHLVTGADIPGVDDRMPVEEHPDAIISLGGNTVDAIFQREGPLPADRELVMRQPHSWRCLAPVEVDPWVIPQHPWVPRKIASHEV